MKKTKLLSIILLVTFSFSSLHAFAISFLDEAHCSVDEYVLEIDNLVVHSDTSDSDICDIHHIFHTPFLLPKDVVIVEEDTLCVTPVTSIKRYSFNSLKNFLKPPISFS